jgi:hypothetical protein
MKNRSTSILLAIIITGYLIGAPRCDGGVSDKESLWPNGSTLNIVFLDGTRENKATVKRIAGEWEKYANLTFQFHDDPKAKTTHPTRRPSRPASGSGLPERNWL